MADLDLSDFPSGKGEELDLSDFPKGASKETPREATKEEPTAPRSAVEWAKGIGEAGLTAVTGAAAGLAGLGAEAATALPGLSGMTARAVAGKLGMGGTPEQTKAKVQRAGTYEPRSEAGKYVLGRVGDVEGTAQAAREVVAEKGGGPVVQETMGAIAKFSQPALYAQKISEAGEWLKDQVPEKLRPAVDLLYNAALYKVPAAPKAVEAASKYVVRGGEAARKGMARNIETFERVGVTRPTVGQVSEGGATKGAMAAESSLERQAPQVLAGAQRIADQISSAKSPEAAGTIIERAIEGTGRPKSGGWLDKVKVPENALWDDYYAKIDGKDVPAPSTNLRQAFVELTSVSKTSPQLSAAFRSPKIADLAQRFRKDVEVGQLTASPSFSLGDLREFKTWLGEQLDPANPAPELVGAQRARLYAALKQDELALARAKGPEALTAYERADRFTTAKHKLIDEHIRPILDAGVPEKIYEAAVSGTKDGASRIRSTLSVLNKPQKDAVRSVFTRELGRRGEVFDGTQFLEGWGSMHGNAKRELFNTSQIADLDALARVLEKSKASQNTLYAIRNYGVQHSAEGAIGGLAYVTGHFGVGTVLLGGAGAGFLTGRLVSNPTFTRWLASATAKGPNSVVPMLGNLARRAEEMPEEDKNEVDQYLQNIKGLVTPGPRPESNSMTEPHSPTKVDAVWGLRG